MNFILPEIGCYRITASMPCRYAAFLKNGAKYAEAWSNTDNVTIDVVVRVNEITDVLEISGSTMKVEYLGK